MSEKERAFLAEKVMGWKPHCRNSAFYVDATKVEAMISREDIKAIVGGWRPDIDPAASMEVLRMIGEYANRQSGRFNYRTDGETHWVSIEDIIYIQHEAQAPTLELAICLLAKKLHETKEPNP